MTRTPWHDVFAIAPLKEEPAESRNCECQHINQFLFGVEVLLDDASSEASSFVRGLAVPAGVVEIIPVERPHFSHFGKGVTITVTAPQDKQSKYSAIPPLFYV